MERSWKPNVTVAAVIERDGRFLVVEEETAEGLRFNQPAGHLEQGESLLEACRREVLEESGIRLGRVVYHASQPWPFPYSLMIGCFGEALTDDIAFDGRELEDCRWFSRDEVRTMIAGSHPHGLVVPPSGAIAHHLIRFWVEAG